MDYVKSEYRGKAVALQSFGSLFGEAFAMTVLFGISKGEDMHMNTAFLIAAIVTGSMSFLTLFFVRNPTIKKDE